MTVYVVLEETWDDTEILGVYASCEDAARAHEGRGGGTWVLLSTAQPDTCVGYMEGLDRGHAVRIVEHAVQ